VRKALREEEAEKIANPADRVEQTDDTNTDRMATISQRRIDRRSFSQIEQLNSDPPRGDPSWQLESTHSALHTRTNETDDFIGTERSRRRLCTAPRFFQRMPILAETQAQSNGFYRVN
jgi:hypothetical protein